MRVVITGHTGGLGLAFFNYFTSRGDEVIGVSRSNGYSLPEKFEEVIALATGADLFVNNVHLGVLQARFIERLYKHTSIITCGSMAADHMSPDMLTYSINKKYIEIKHKTIKKEAHLPMLLLKMGFLENWTEYNSIPYSQIINGVDFWLTNPRASMIEFDNVNYSKQFTK